MVAKLLYTTSSLFILKNNNTNNNKCRPTKLMSAKDFRWIRLQVKSRQTLISHYSHQNLRSCYKGDVSRLTTTTGIGRIEMAPQPTTLDISEIILKMYTDALSPLLKN
jgi:hypothetical protein